MEARLKRLVPKHPPWIQAHAAVAVEPGLSSLMCTEQKEFWVGVSKFLDCIHLSTSVICRKRHDWSCNGQWRYRPRWGRFGYIGVCDYKLGRRPGLILYASYFSAHILGYGCCVICCDFPQVEKVSCKAGGHRFSLSCQILPWGHLSHCPVISSRRPVMLFEFFFFSISIGSCVCKKVLKVKKPKVCATGSPSLPQKTLLLKCLKLLASSPAFNSVTLWHHTISQCRAFK